MNILKKISSILLGVTMASFLLCEVPRLQAADTYLDVSKVDQAPTPKKPLKPDYPSSLRKKNPPPTINLRLDISADGKVKNLTIVKFSDVDMVDPIYAVYETAVFNPALKDGKPVACRMEMTITYSK